MNEAYLMSISRGLNAGYLAPVMLGHLEKSFLQDVATMKTGEKQGGENGLSCA
jgi:hypothetical protein